MEFFSARGRGMHVMGFVPRDGGINALLPGRPLVHASSSKATAPTKVIAEDTAENANSRFDICQQEDTSASTVRGPTQTKNGREVARPIFSRGNYDKYYGYRHADGSKGEHDPRLLRIEKRFGPGVFDGKEVLDIGCNSGQVSLGVRKSFQASRVVGIDVDASLIEAANSLRSQLECNVGIEFRAEDILHSPLKRPPSMKRERFDVILCLSVTKWVHYHYGDEGVRNLFRRCYKRLRPGGLLILEPQDWKSYKKKQHISAEVRKVVRSIELFPSQFKDFLCGYGFEEVGVLDAPPEATACFQRTIQVFRRPEAGQNGTMCNYAGIEAPRRAVEERRTSGDELATIKSTAKRKMKKSKRNGASEPSRKRAKT